MTTAQPPQRTSAARTGSVRPARTGAVRADDQADARRRKQPAHLVAGRAEQPPHRAAAGPAPAPLGLRSRSAGRARCSRAPGRAVSRSPCRRPRAGRRAGSAPRRGTTSRRRRPWPRRRPAGARSGGAADPGAATRTAAGEGGQHQERLQRLGEEGEAEQCSGEHEPSGSGRPRRRGWWPRPRRPAAGSSGRRGCRTGTAGGDGREGEQQAGEQPGHGPRSGDRRGQQRDGRDAHQRLRHEHRPAGQPEHAADSPITQSDAGGLSTVIEFAASESRRTSPSSCALRPAPRPA